MSNQNNVKVFVAIVCYVMFINSSKYSKVLFKAYYSIQTVWLPFIRFTCIKTWFEFAIYVSTFSDRKSAGYQLPYSLLKISDFKGIQLCNSMGLVTMFWGLVCTSNKYPACVTFTVFDI